MRNVVLLGAGFGLALLLSGGAALAQQPATPRPELGTPPPALPPPVAPPAPVPAPGAGVTNEIIGRSYNVELLSGTSFIGELTAASAQELSFQTKDLGPLVIQRANIKQLNLLTTDQAKRGYDYIGNGSRLSFAPTARNLRRGEGAVQNAYIFLMGVNYGISDYISVGTLFTWIPGLGSDNLFALTPKVSFPVRENFHVGGGALIAFVGGESATLAYANTTYGSADNNVTAGIGYGFAGGERSSTPLLMVGGITRVSRRVSLLNETYLFNNRDDFRRSTVLAGIAGIRISGQRLSGGLGLAYSFYSYQDRYNYSPGYSDGDSSADAIPFGELTLRFGRVN